MKQLWIHLVSISLALLTIVPTASAQSSGSGGSSRPWLLSSAAEGRASKRFTLQEWLENKDRRALMDMWLSLNTPSPYELVFGGGQMRYDLTETTSGVVTTTSHDVFFGEISAYAKFVGLTAEYQNNLSQNYNALTGQFNLRIFGNTVQGSHITLHYGLRTQTESSGLYRLNQTYPAVTLQIYLMKYFGIDGHYRAYGEYAEPTLGNTSGDELRAGLFVEYGLMRIFGQHYEERQTSKTPTTQTDSQKKGTRVGLMFYF